MDPGLLRDLRAAVQAVLPQVTDLRRRIHADPELQLQEYRTRDKVLALLRQTTAAVQPPLLGPDLIADLQGQGAGKICLRADLDALPIHEATGRPYASTVPGVMHACGHDGHTAILAGAGLVLDQFRARLPVSVRLVFQPGEEMVCAGAELVAKGALEGVTAAFALHGWPGLPAGVVGSRSGALFAAADAFVVTLTGRGGHGAMPHLAESPIPVAARAIGRLQELHVELQRERGAVLSVCTVHSGDAVNVIPDQAVLKGTVRYLEPGFGEVVKARMTSRLAQATAGSTVKAELAYRTVYSLPTLNHAPAVARLRRLATRYLPPGSWVDVPAPSMGAEDFALYLAARPGAMFWLGQGVDHPGLHHPAFDFSEESLGNGMLMFCLLALTWDEPL